jgi:thymidylate synthase (FAD)
MKIFKSDKFPKMEISLYDAPANPRHIIAFSYLECIEDRKLPFPSAITREEATKITEWVLKGGHTPSLESIHLCFNIRGISRIVSHQLVRHRIGVSIDQRTQRANSKEYLGKLATNKHYILPPAILSLFDRDAFEMRTFKDELNNYFYKAEGLYDELLSLGISEDDARYIMPHNAETSMNFKVIYKALMHICSVRLCSVMQSEIIEVTRLMKKAVDEYDELLGSWLKPVCLNQGWCNRNENNPNEDNPKGVCHFTIDGTIPVRNADNTFNLTKFSKDGTK